MNKRVSSKMIAEKFGFTHKMILRIIEDVIKNDNPVEMFEPNFYVENDDWGEEYLITRAGFEKYLKDICTEVNDKNTVGNNNKNYEGDDGINNLVNIVNNEGTLVVSSRDVAQNFGKRHGDLLESIENLVTEKSVAKMFHKTTYMNRGKEYPEYLMNRDGFSLLVMGFNNSKKALEWKLKYIEAFNLMEESLKQAIPMLTDEQRLQLAIFQARTVDEAGKASAQLDRYRQQQLAEKDAIIQDQLPKVQFAEAIEGSKDSIHVADMAKILAGKGIKTGQNRLFKWLRANGYLTMANRPTQYSMELGIMEVNENYRSFNGSTKLIITPLITAKGQKYFVKKFIQEIKIA